MILVLWAIVVIFAYWVVPNVTVFGPGYLVARKLAPAYSARRTALTLGFAFLVAFGLRLPGIASDLAYHFGGDPVRYIKQRVKVPAGTRVGLDLQLDHHSTVGSRSRDADEPVALFRQRYFPAVRPGGENIGVGRVQLMYEEPRPKLLRQELVLNEKTPESETLQIHVHGRETDSHYEVDVTVSRGGETLATYRDRFRLRWPFPNKVVGYLTQMSILDEIADSAFPGSLVDLNSPNAGPIATFLGEAIEVEQRPLPPAVSARIVTRPVEVAQIPRRASPDAQWAPGDCVSPGVDSADQVLSYRRDGISRWRSSEFTVGAEKTRGITAVACTETGVATITIGDSSQVNRYFIVAFDRSLEVQCVLSIEMPDSVLARDKSWTIADFATTPIGFRVHFSERAPKDKWADEAFRVDIEAPVECANRLGMPAIPSESDLQLAAAESEQATDALSNQLTSRWSDLLAAQYARWRQSAIATCAKSDPGVTSAPAPAAVTAACRLAASDVWAQAVVKYQQLLHLQQRRREFTRQEIQSLGNLIPRVVIVRERNEDPGSPEPGAEKSVSPGMGSMRAVTIDLREEERPLLLAIESSTHDKWRISQSPGVWLLGWSHQCPPPCGHDPRIRTSVRGIGFDLPEKISSDISHRFPELVPDVIAVPTSGIVRIGDAPDGNIASPMDQSDRSDSGKAELSSPGTRDKYDRLVDEAVRRAGEAPTSAAPIVAFRDLRKDLDRLPGEFTVWNLFLQDAQVVVSVDQPARPVFLVIRGGPARRLTIRTRSPSRIAGILLDKSMDKLAIDAPSGVRIYSTSASDGLSINEALGMMLRRGGVEMRSEFAAGGNPLVLR